MNIAMQKSEVKTIRTEKTISWGGIVAGVVVAVMIGILLDLLGISLSASSFSINDNAFSSITSISAVWFIITGIVSMYWGGWVAGYFSQSVGAKEGFIHGIITYCLATFITLLALTTAIAFFINGALNMLEKSFNMATTAITSVTEVGTKTVSAIMPKAKEIAATVAPNLSPALDNITDQIKELLKKSNIAHEAGGSPEEAINKIKDAFSQFIQATNSYDKNEARKHLTEIISNATGLSTSDVEQKISDWGKLYNEQKEVLNEKLSAAQDMANNAVNTMGHVALINFIILLLSAVAAGMGGILGVMSSRE